MRAVAVFLAVVATTTAAASTSNVDRVAVSQESAARFVLPKAPAQPNVRLNVDLVQRNGHVVTSALSLRLIGKLSNLHKLRACVNTPPRWGDEDNTVCAVPASDQVYTLNLADVIQSWCQTGSQEEAGNKQ